MIIIVDRLQFATFRTFVLLTNSESILNSQIPDEASCNFSFLSRLRATTEHGRGDQMLRVPAYDFRARCRDWKLQLRRAGFTVTEKV